MYENAKMDFKKKRTARIDILFKLVFIISSIATLNDVSILFIFVRVEPSSQSISRHVDS